MKIELETMSVQRVGMGGPKYANPAYTGEHWWEDNGKLRRRHILDSYAQHTSKCTACSKVGANVRTPPLPPPLHCTADINRGATGLYVLVGSLNKRKQRQSETPPCLNICLATYLATSLEPNKQPEQENPSIRWKWTSHIGFFCAVAGASEGGAGGSLCGVRGAVPGHRRAAGQGAGPVVAAGPGHLGGGGPHRLGAKEAQEPGGTHDLQGLGAGRSRLGPWYLSPRLSTHPLIGSKRT